MVQIITAGIAPGQRTFEASCNTCKTKFSFKQWEAKYNSDNRDGDYLSIRCPLIDCGNSVTVQVHPRVHNMTRRVVGSLDR